MMRVANHGGRCCGIKHIHGFPYSPNDMVAALPLRVVFQGAGREMRAPGGEFYPGPRNAEKGSTRFNALLAYIKSKKTGHLVEVVLTTGVASNWHELLTKKGFKKVAEFHNSNTFAELCVYHMIIKGGKVITGNVEINEEVEEFIDITNEEGED